MIELIIIRSYNSGLKTQKKIENPPPKRKSTPSRFAIDTHNVDPFLLFFEIPSSFRLLSRTRKFHLTSHLVDLSRDTDISISIQILSSVQNYSSKIPTPPSLVKQRIST
ncbi:hypothetical protein EYC84_003306 [Monilinia fructicola]|uniref:Uncharacterized protein n=1 Tax=Monilinia fructicola TaxID=38448 RepID=A0A5M9JXU2_MONFR|nr:hypothetical protein EYC84_003306 [Monilinia fructicola]